jgi:outer membrane lipoprotein-sorting protein
MSNVITTQEFKSILVLAFVTMAFFASGCTEKNLSAEEIAAQMMDKQNSIQDYSYTLHTTSYLGEKTIESDDKFVLKKPNKSKEILTEPGTGNQSIFVYDGEFMWHYNIPDTHEVVKTKISGIPELTQNDCINMIGEILNSTNVTLLGMEKVDGRNAYMLKTTPKETNESSQLPDRTKIWVDKETWIPLKYEIYNSDGNPFTIFEIRDLKINSGIPDSEFQFEIPKDAKIVEEKLPEILSLDEARKKVSFKILTPEYLPEGYSFNSSMFFNNSMFGSDEVFETVDLTFMNGKESIGITETVYENMSSDTKSILSDGEDIKINGIEGKYLSIGDEKVLRWKLGTVYLSLFASLEKDELLKIAESIS